MLEITVTYPIPVAFQDLINLGTCVARLIRSWNSQLDLQLVNTVQ